MDFNSLKDSVSSLTLYDLKAGVRKVQNAVMNYTEMEAKVREATNNEPWGASSTLMQEIANGTFNYQTLNEIMPMIYRRFTEKAAEEWRQIYKALQLLEFLIKHGSERVIDDARSHLTLLKMLRQFHFIDPNGKDQGINVRNRAKELADLLSDVDRIRSERKKARANKAKFTGVEGGGGGSIGGGSSGRYSGFGSESGGYGGYSGGVYGDGGVYGGRTNEYSEYGGGGSSGGGGGAGGSSRSEQFEEYDEYDEGERPARSQTSSAGARAGVKRTTGGGGSISMTSKRAEQAAPPAPPKKKEPEVDLFSFDEPAASSGGGGALEAPALAAGSGGDDDDDDFADFQEATALPAAPTNALAGLSLSSAYGAQFAAPQPVSAPKQADLAGMVGLSSISPPPASTSTPGGAPNYSAFHAPPPVAAAAAPAVAPQAAGFRPAQPNYFQSVQVQAPSSTSAMQTTSVFPQSQSQHRHASSTSGAAAGMAALRPVLPSATSSGSGGSNNKSGSGDAFGALWSQASTTIKKPTTTAGPGPSMGQLAQEKSNAAIWGTASTSTPSTPKPVAASSSSNGLDDLLG
ncbi:golgi to endosome transport protein [Grosmannia clavigera kw1407]|uniref:Golgi to endosome transport protein n=1 Tax=Grosmannia clavigera (strain kw1407 / UAMH 11150) TaxID=655863 RepID=F0XCW2_GROCL|nr:golgi to endosome transport protein [Grosmannia clavigera kw1407]EFX04523.1 golgi to endosome transport protein [Grosmannia clavigera kw1407]